MANLGLIRYKDTNYSLGIDFTGDEFNGRFCAASFRAQDLTLDEEWQMDNVAQVIMSRDARVAE